LIVVLDASVVLKWFFRSREEEADVDGALAILAGIDSGRFRMVQPPHFLAEVAAVLAREKPHAAHEDVRDLQDIAWQAIEAEEIYATALDLSVRLGHHLFDTLYHATALHVPDSLFVTADARYHERAKHEGRIKLLAEFDAGE
jgi:predicted nucleic acid-binding protein